MWMYSGVNDTSWVHPEEVTNETVDLWLKGITGNKDNPRGVRRVDPFDTDNQSDKVYTEMYSMPNGEQALEQDQEGEDSVKESSDWQSPDDDDEESDDRNLVIFGAQFAELEKKQISLNFDLELAKKNLKKAQDEVATMGGGAREKALPDKKLASFNKLEEENSKLKTAVTEANQEVARLKKDQESLTDEVGSLKAKKGELEAYLEWKKSSAHCGADVALSLVRVHYKDVREDKLAPLKPPPLVYPKSLAAGCSSSNPSLPEPLTRSCALFLSSPTTEPQPQHRTSLSSSQTPPPPSSSQPWSSPSKSQPPPSPSKSQPPPSPSSSKPPPRPSSSQSPSSPSRHRSSIVLQPPSVPHQGLDLGSASGLWEFVRQLGDSTLFHYFSKPLTFKSFRKGGQESRFKSEGVAQNRGGSLPFVEARQILAEKYGPEKATTLNTYAAMKSGLKNWDGSGSTSTTLSGKAKNALMITLIWLEPHILMNGSSESWMGKYYMNHQVAFPMGD
ncbi:uncharacterized protein DDB_G0284459 [Triticum aestivum]|uniref:uncharacterized protein DDB_G0284459 n=1 Tax=Triticum aestivum TaxID=4565 RepID=UPI001D005C90|nr:uncharacterized protein DDB_G0284459-like [Triticum aestivum]